MKNKKRKKILVYLLLIAAFIYFEFFFLGVQMHQEYVETSLTRDEAIKECPDIEVSESDRTWMIQVLEALEGKSFADGEYSLQELELPLHPYYLTEDTKIKVTHLQLPYREEEERLYISVSFDSIIMKSGNKKVSLNVSEVTSAFNSNEYYELEYSKGVRYYLHSIFTKELPDIIYGCSNQGYGMLELKHKWFAIVRGFFTMK